MKQEKQAPEELVKEMKAQIHMFRIRVTDSNEAADNCAKIAMKHAEKSNEKCLKLILHFQLFLSGKGYHKNEKDERAFLQKEIDELLKQYGE